MQADLIAFYGGPDQVMTVTSGLASLLGLLLVFWNKVVGVFFRIVNSLRAKPVSEPEVTTKPGKTK